MRDKGGAGAENNLLRLRNTASFYCTYIYCEDFIYLRIIKGLEEGLLSESGEGCVMVHNRLARKESV